MEPFLTFIKSDAQPENIMYIEKFDAKINILENVFKEIIQRLKN